MRTILNTVGTSLLTNAARSLGIADPNEKQIYHYLHGTVLEKAAAETNSIDRLLREGDRLVFLHSHTAQGKLCADLLCRYFSGKKISCGVEAVPDLAYQESRFKMLGLRSLVSTIIKLINGERAVGRQVIINATGGFKAEIAYATLIGLLFDVPVFYIHEAFKEIIEMPPVPISWDYSLIADYEEFFEWLDSDLRPIPEADGRIKGLPSEVRFLLTDEDGYTLLSPVGEVFFEAYKARAFSFADAPIFLSDKARRALAGAPPNEEKLLEQSLRKLRDPVLRRSGSEQKINSDCLVYPKGHRPERIFFYEDEDRKVYVCDLTGKHDVYVRMLDQGGVWRRDYNGFSLF